MLYMWGMMSWVVSVIGVLTSVAFLTLLERKILSYAASRKGPNKVSLMGLLQPMGDAVKLFVKEMGQPWVSNLLLFWVSPMISVMLLLFGWYFIYFFSSVNTFYMSMTGLLCVSSLQVYVLLWGGWGSKSKYSLLGSLRGSAQTMSYEVSLVFMVLIPCCLWGGLDLSLSSGFKMLGVLPIFFVWVTVCLAETNRSPFDFAEGESELVSGFKVEYGALHFAFLYLSEYGSIVLLSYLTSLLFLPSWLFFIFMIYIFMWVRSTLPRFRYDKLMEMSWGVFLPLVLGWVYLLFLIM